MRVLVYCAGSYVSGAEIVELSVMQGLQDRGHTVHCITNAWNDGEFHRRLEEANISYESISLGAISASLEPKYLWWTLNALLHLPKAYLDFRRALSRFDPDAILFSGARSLSAILPVVDLEKVVLHVHGRPGNSYHFRRVMTANEKGGCGAYVAVSEFIGECLEERGVPPERIQVVPNGIRVTEKVQSSKKESDVPVITIAGQVEPWKGHADLIEALGLLAESTTDWKCHVVGTGDENYIERMKEKVRRTGLSGHVVWRGFQQDMGPVYSETDILVVPSRHQEPFGLVAAEAGMYGIPVIASRRGGLPEIVEHENTGFLVDAEAPQQIARWLEKLIRSQQLRIRIGEAAHERIRSTFTRSEMIDGITQMLEDVNRKA
ncbi:glycosyltransferase involved in cell wall biosynthesis [Salinibacter ruber]|uniref:glycosyltransferase family 4 protein n=1 Tax=Salinibacter ruber TaxID=146919 RepID=UPI002167CC4E|nr:glycosyltransferase family 4 protein [Salinibacter ruber]MCS4086111.1 glycosyltransferase involved in cell wall biosynthesis [Salinibacter ruber]